MSLLFIQNKNINATCNNFKDFTELQFTSGNQSNAWDLLFQLMKHGADTLHVAFIVLFSAFSITQAKTGSQLSCLPGSHCLSLLAGGNICDK